MKKEYDLSGAKRAGDVEHLNRLRAGKTRITIMLDDDILAAFRERTDAEDIGYQTLINQALRQQLARQPLDEATIRRILREEIRASL